MTRISNLALFSLFALAACGGGGSPELVGVAPEGAVRVFALDTAGNAYEADAVSGDFHVALTDGSSVVLFVETDSGAVAPLVFDDGQGGTQSRIPAFTGQVDLGHLTIVTGSDPLARLAAGTGASETVESEDNPLAQVDTDDDGDDDYADADDDDDGQEDAEDADDDGNGEDDEAEEMDDDGDGLPDAGENETETETETGSETGTESTG